MSGFNAIAAVYSGVRAAASALAGPPEPASGKNPARELAGELRKRLPSEFVRTLQELRDPPKLTLALQEQQRRVAIAEQQLAQRPPVPASTASAENRSGRGAFGAPTPVAIAPETQRAASAVVLERTRLLALQVQQATWRRDRIAETLPQRYPEGAQLASVSGADAAELRPRTREEAEALAQRVAIDMVMEVAELDVARAEHELARHEAALAGDSVLAERQVAASAVRVDQQHRDVVNAIAVHDVVVGRSPETAVSLGGSNLDSSIELLRRAAHEQAHRGSSATLDGMQRRLARAFVSIMETVNGSLRRQIDQSRESRRSFQRQLAREDASRQESRIAATAQSRRQEWLDRLQNAGQTRRSR